MKKTTLSIVGVLLAVICFAPIQSHAASAQYNITTEQRTALVQTLQAMGSYLNALSAKIAQLKASGQLSEVQRAGMSATLSTMHETLAVLDSSLSSDIASRTEPEAPTTAVAEPQGGTEVAQAAPENSPTAPSNTGPAANIAAAVGENQPVSDGQVAGVSSIASKTGRFLWWSFIFLLIATVVALFYSWRPAEESTPETVTQNTEPNVSPVDPGQNKS